MTKQTAYQDGDRTRILVVALSFARRAKLSALAASGFRRGAVEVVARAGLAAGSERGREMEAAGVDGDVMIADLDGLSHAGEFIEFMEQSGSALAAVALIDDPDPRWVRDALRAGVNAIVSREPGVEELHLAISAADSGLVLLDPTSARSLVPAVFHSPDLSHAHEVEALTARESEVLRLLGRGLGNKEIASRLAISEHTAKFHISSILGKLGAASRTEAVSVGIRRGLIPI